MKQYCRYCCHCHYGDCVYCDVKQKTMSESKAKSVNNCKDFEFNEIDVFYMGDESKVYKPREPKKKQCDFEVEVMEKLADYEDAEEQGLLLRLPCKMGSTVYIISRGKVIPLKIDGIYVNENSVALCGMNEQYYGYGKVTLYESKTPIEWFLTKEEAEQVLKQMGVRG